MRLFAIYPKIPQKMLHMYFIDLVKCSLGVQNEVETVLKFISR